MNCTICDKPLYGLVCSNKWCNEEHYQCSCGKILNGSDTYEYRGVRSCHECFDKVRLEREQERQEIIVEESAKQKS